MATPADTIPERGTGMTDELKPCPFCGSSAVIRSNGEYQYYVRCTNFDCSVHPTTYVMTTPEKAIAAWNRREEK